MIAIFSGAQLFALGVIGEYLAHGILLHYGTAGLRGTRSDTD